MRTSLITLTTLCALSLVACGDDDGGGGGGSYGSITSAIESPTGTVDATTAVDVADEFELINGSNAGGKQAQTTSMPCPNGGSLDINASSSGGMSGTANIEYNNCCYQADCCYAGGGVWFFSAEAGATYSYCADYSLSLECLGETANVTYEGCFDANGWVYVVRVNGESFAVTGQYSSGNGTLEITGANGSYSCTYSNYTGSCTGSEGEFSF